MKYRKKLAILLVLLMFISSTLVVSAGDDKVATKAYVKVATNLNVRKGPSTRYKVISKLKPGEIVTVEYTTKNGWSKVELADGSEGYVSNDYIVIPDIDLEEYELISAAVITSQSSSENRDFNMARACESIDGLVLEPEDEFDWFGDEDTQGVVGSADKANGYKKATVISGGKYVQGYGGGVCQVSTAVYNCIYKLDIEPIEHHHHSLKSSYVEEGMDATVAYPYKNFVFSNTLDYSIMFEAYTDGGQVVMLVYRVLEKDKSLNGVEGNS